MNQKELFYKVKKQHSIVVIEHYETKRWYNPKVIGCYFISRVTFNSESNSIFRQTLFFYNYETWKHCNDSSPKEFVIDLFEFEETDATYDIIDLDEFIEEHFAELL